MAFTIYHHPTCSKSKAALDSLISSGEEIHIIDYLNTKPDAAELLALLKKLNKRPEELLRKKEPVFQALYEGKNLTDRQIIEAMITYPELIERPIVIKGDKAWITRDAETIHEILQLT